jgi:hypothetical protein
MFKQNTYDSYLRTYSGRELLKAYSLEETGVWRVYGEDPNCDLGGSHHQPDLGTFAGYLKDVIEYAVELPNFWQWGGGGRIVKENGPTIITRDSVKERKELLAKREELEQQLREVKRKLGESND